MKFFAELKRRNVYKVGIGYLVLGWVVVQVTSEAVPALHLPDWVNTLVFFIGIVGFPFVLFFAWVFELTPEGIKRESHVSREQSTTHDTGRKLDFIIIGLLVIALGYFIWESKFKSRDSEPTALATTSAESQTKPSVSITSYSEPKISIAVLPFDHLSNNDEELYFTDGIHDELLSQLARLNVFNVISRTSVMEFRNSKKNIREIAEELGVSKVVEGTVKRLNDRIKISVQLIDAENDEYLWGQQFERELTTDDIFNIQTEISNSIAKTLTNHINVLEKLSRGNAPTQNLAAYESFLKAKPYLDTIFDVDSIDKAIHYYQQALQIDPEFKQAYAMLAYSWANRYWASQDMRDRDYAEKFIGEIEHYKEDFFEKLLAKMFYVYRIKEDYSRALIIANELLAEYPQHPEVLKTKMAILKRTGRWDEALAIALKIDQLNPHYVEGLLDIAFIYMALDRNFEANNAIERMINRSPNSEMVRSYAALFFIALGREEKLLRHLINGLESSDNLHALRSYIQVKFHLNDYSSLSEVIESLKKISLDGNLQDYDYLLFDIYYELVTGNQLKAEKKAAEAVNIILERADLSRQQRYCSLTDLYAVLGLVDELDNAILECERELSYDLQALIFLDYNKLRFLAVINQEDRLLSQLETMAQSPNMVTKKFLLKTPLLAQYRDNPEFMKVIAQFN